MVLTSSNVLQKAEMWTVDGVLTTETPCAMKASVDNTGMLA